MDEGGNKMKTLIHTLAIIGVVFIAVLGHELYHWFAGKPIEMCINLDGMYVRSYKQSSEVWAYLILFLIALLLFIGIVYTERKK